MNSNFLNKKINDINSKNKKEFWYFKSESHHHNLVIVQLKLNIAQFNWNNKVNKPLISFKCSKCFNTINNNNLVYYCSLCRFILCINCKEKEIKGNVNQLNYNFHNHPLSKLLRENFICDYCNLTYYIPSEFFYFTKCDLDICITCINKHTNNTIKISIDVKKMIRGMIYY